MSRKNSGSAIQAEPQEPRRLTQSSVNALKTQGRRFEVTDSEIPGLRVRVTSNGTKSYALLYRNDDGRRVRFTIGKHGAVTLKQARDVARSVLGDVARGKDPQREKKSRRSESKRRASVPTLQQFIEGDFAEWASVHRRGGQHVVKRLLAAFRPRLGDRLDTITAWKLNKHRAARLKQGRKPSTLNRDLSDLSTLFRIAVEAGVVNASPVRELKALRETQDKRVRYLTDDEERRLRGDLDRRDQRIRQRRTSANDWREVRGCELHAELPSTAFGDHLTPLVLLSLNTGIRRGEAFHLVWDEVHLDGPTPHLTVRAHTAKSLKTRRLPLNAEVLQVLRRWRDQRAGEDIDLVFPGKNGRPMDNVRNSWSAIVEAADLQDFRWHDLRHSFASKLVMNGVDLNSVRELLGHADLKMTLRYAHLGPDHLQDAVEKLVSNAGGVTGG